MKYKKIYMKFFDLTADEFIPCEICQGDAVDIHHIDINRKNNDIHNLIALCRQCHTNCHANKEYNKWCVDRKKQIHAETYKLYEQENKRPSWCKL